jgi:hypothetical protein
MAEQCRVNTELEALHVSAALDWDLVLGDVDGPFSLVAPLSMVVEGIEG